MDSSFENCETSFGEGVMRVATSGVKLREDEDAHTFSTTRSAMRQTGGGSIMVMSQGEILFSCIATAFLKPSLHEQVFFGKFLAK